MPNIETKALYFLYVLLLISMSSLDRIGVAGPHVYVVL